MKVEYHEVFVSDGSIVNIPNQGVIDGPRIIGLGRQDSIMTCVAWLESVK